LIDINALTRHSENARLDWFQRLQTFDEQLALAYDPLENDR